MKLCVCRYGDSFNFQIIYSGDKQEIIVAPGDVVVTVDEAEPLSRVEEYFISVTIDSGAFSNHFGKMNFRLFRFWIFYYVVKSVVCEKIVSWTRFKL